MKSETDIRQELRNIKERYTERAKVLDNNTDTIIKEVQREEWARWKMLEWVLS